jgi:predicted anti-sigma-YlaC factor YlaD
MSEALRPVELGHEIPGSVAPPVPRYRRHKRKRRLSIRQKRWRLAAVLSAIVGFGLFLAFLWLMNRPY